jgi:hypothetical protein
MDALHGYCDEILPIRTALEQWFNREGEELIFRRGKHKGQPLAEVAAQEADYLEWMLGADDMDAEVLEVVREALTAGIEKDD